MLDVRRLRLLCDLARLGTIAAVAASRNYTASAVSQQLSALEREAGVRLLARTGRSVTLTAAGRILVRHGTTVLAELEQATASLAAVAGGLTGPLRIGAFPTAIRALFPAALVALGRSHPGLELMVTELDPAGVPAALRDRRIDVGLINDYDLVPARPDPALDDVPLLDEPVYLALPQAWADEAVGPVRVGDGALPQAGAGEAVGLGPVGGGPLPQAGAGEAVGLGPVGDDLLRQAGAGEAVGLGPVGDDLLPQAGAGEAVGLRRVGDDLLPQAGAGEAVGLRRVGDPLLRAGAGDALRPERVADDPLPQAPAGEGARRERPGAARGRLGDGGAGHVDAVNVDGVDAVNMSGRAPSVTSAAGVALAGLRDAPWILATPGTVCHTVTVQLCRAAGFSPRARHHADDFTTVLSLVAAGLGVSVVPAMAVEEGRAGGVRLEALPTRRRSRIAYRKGAAGHPAVAAFVAAISESCRFAPSVRSG